MRDIYKLRGKNIYKLVELAQIGDKKAMGIILNRFEPMAKSLAAKYFGTWADFEDFLQVGFVGLMQAVFNYKRESNTKFSTFAYMNISSEVKSFITYLNRQKNKVLTEAINIESYTDDDSSDSGEYYFETESNETKELMTKYFLEKAVAELKTGEQDIINLWLNGYTYEEISDKIDVNRKKVDNTIQKLKRIIAKKEDLYNTIELLMGGGKFL